MENATIRVCSVVQTTETYNIKPSHPLLTRIEVEPGTSGLELILLPLAPHCTPFVLCWKMYEEMKAENEKLKKQVGSLETEVTDLRRQSRGSRAGSAGDSLADKRVST